MGGQATTGNDRQRQDGRAFTRAGWSRASGTKPRLMKAPRDATVPLLGHDRWRREEVLSLPVVACRCLPHHRCCRSAMHADHEKPPAAPEHRRRRRARDVPACKPGPVAMRTWRTVIPLGVRSPARSSSLPAASRSGRAVPRRLFGLAPAGVYPATSVAGGAVRSYRTFSPLPDPLARPSAVCFLWHCPSRRRACHHARHHAQALPGGLPCGARTFLDRTSEDPCRDRPAGTHRTRKLAPSLER